MSITYQAVLDVSKPSVQLLSKLLHEERVRRGTRKGTRALSTDQQAVLLRWFLDDTCMSALARDTRSAGRRSTATGTRASSCWRLANRRCTTPCWQLRQPATHTSSWTAR